MPVSMPGAASGVSDRSEWSSNSMNTRFQTSSQRGMPRRPADLLEVVVLASHAEATLEVHGPRIASLLCAGQRVLEGHHSRVDEEQRVVARGDQARAGHDRVAVLREELDEARAD